MSDRLETRDAPDGSLEVLDADGQWRHVPHAAAQYIRNINPPPGFEYWEWRVSQTYVQGIGKFMGSDAPLKARSSRAD